MRVGIVGCGFIGQKRAAALADSCLVACADSIEERAVALARSQPCAVATSHWQALVERPDVDIVVVCTTHDALAEVTAGAVAAGKHVLVEKPAARRAAELDPIIAAASAQGSLVRVGFNHRYHPAFRKLSALVADGGVGELLYVRGRYGHGGRLGYEREWRANPALSGGGELIDQGMHLIDLARWILGDFVEVHGLAPTYFWQMAVEDNGFLLLRTASGRVAFLHASWTEWKNLFSFEVFGRTGKLEVSGLGGSYGIERLAYYRMTPLMGPPKTVIWEYPGADGSWAAEFSEFLNDIRLGRQPDVSLADARAALAIVEQVYQGTGQ